MMAHLFWDVLSDAEMNDSCNNFKVFQMKNSCVGQPMWWVSQSFVGISVDQTHHCVVNGL